MLPWARRPLLASYKLTYQCNLRCQQCPFPQYTAAPASFEEVCAVLDRLRERGDRLVVFEGGEPLLWKDGSRDFRSVVRYARERFACVGVTTNGTLPLDAIETDILWVSVDGFAQTHNRLRQAEIFDRVVEHMRRSNHPRLYAHLTANAENAAEIPELVRFLSEIVKGITIQFYYPYGPDDHLFLPWEERRALLDRLIQLKGAGYPVLNSVPGLRALQGGGWRCLPMLVDCANPDGSIYQGCYLHGRAEIDCQKCGFSPYTEMSLALRGNPQAVLAGMQIFLGMFQPGARVPQVVSK